MGKDTFVSTDIDFDADGVQVSTLRVPNSHDRSAYGHVPIPIFVARNGPGPTMLLTGGVHGDEHEGPYFLYNFIRSFELDRLRGRIIVIPVLNMPAFLDSCRVSPIDGINLNRAFPGNRNGTPTDIIAHFVDSVILPMVDYCIDAHAGGSSLNYVPSLLHWPAATPEIQARQDALIEVFGAPISLAMDMLGEDRTMVAAVARHGAVVLAGEFGGAGGVNLDGLAVLRDGTYRVMKEIGIYNADSVQAAAATTRHMRVNGAAGYVFAPGNGHFEPAYRLGDTVARGQVAGYLHDPLNLMAEPRVVAFGDEGLVLCTRTFAATVAGDCLAHLAKDI